MTIPIILASGSPIRARLLDQVGIPFDVQVPRIDESSLRASLESDQVSPRNIADALSEAKAVRVSAKNPGRLVLGSDQLLVLDGTIYAKPESRDDALTHLKTFQGKSHDLIAGAVIAEDGAPIWRHIETVKLQMRTLTDDALNLYLDQAWPDVSGCVGCYELEAEGLGLFSRISGDYHAALGLPILPVLSYLSTRGSVSS